MKQRELLQSQTNAEDQDNSKSSEIIHREQFEDSPIWIVGTEEKGYFATLGKYRLIEPKETPEAVKLYLMDNYYTVTITIITTICKTIMEEISKTN